MLLRVTDSTKMVKKLSLIFGFFDKFRDLFYFCVTISPIFISHGDDFTWCNNALGAVQSNYIFNIEESVLKIQS